MSPQGNGQTEKQKACSKAGFLNLAPLTGISLAINWLIGKLNLKIGVVKTTRMTTFLCMGILVKEPWYDIMIDTLVYLLLSMFF